MVIEVIERIDDFYALEDNWRFIYEMDCHAQFFSSWVWLFSILKRYTERQDPWFILAAKTSSSATKYIAFFPILVTLEEKLSVCNEFHQILSVVGRGESDSRLFISLPEYAKSAAIEFTKYLQKYCNWSVLKVENALRSDQRIHLFLSKFRNESFDLHEHRFVNDLDHIDYSIVPYISLPASWDEYLQNFISSNMRQKIRRFFRKINGSNEFRITHATQRNLELHLDVLLGLWQASWVDRKGEDFCKKVVARNKFILRHCFDYNCLYLPVLWQGNKPLGAIANIIDAPKRAMLFLVAGRDETIKQPPPGLILHAHAIQYAIQNEFKIYDFLMGNEAYKYSFGAQERHMTIFVIRRKHQSSQNLLLDSRSIPKALQLTVFHHQSNHLDAAARGYRQILAVEPKHPTALYGLSVVMQRQGDCQVAEDLLRELIQVEPTDAKAWFSLGNLHQIQGQLSDAEQAYRQALTLQPEVSAVSLAIYHNLGYTLQQQGRLEEAIACYQKARELHPASTEADVMWANALYAQGTLSPEKLCSYAHMNYTLGDRRAQAGDLKAAVEYYRQAVAMKPDFAQAYCHLAMTLQKIGQFEESIACYEKALAYQTDYPEAEVGWFNALYAQGIHEPSKANHFAIMNYELGRNSQKSDSFPKAIEYYRQALTINPHLPEACFNLGEVLRSQGELNEALTWFKKAQILRPGYIEAEVGSANTLHAQERLGREQKTRYAELNYDLGCQCHQSGDLQAAINYYQQAILMNPDLTEVRECLRRTLEQQGNVSIKISQAKQ